MSKANAERHLSQIGTHTLSRRKANRNVRELNTDDFPNILPQKAPLWNNAFAQHYVKSNENTKETQAKANKGKEEDVKSTDSESTAHLKEAINLQTLCKDEIHSQIAKTEMTKRKTLLTLPNNSIPKLVFYTLVHFHCTQQLSCVVC